MSKTFGDRGNDSYGTPAWLVECCRTLMGGIDLDPFSSKEHNSIVKAATYYDKYFDGFTHDWNARFWKEGPPKVLVNPPGGASRGTQQAFKKMVLEYEKNRISQACFIAFSIDALSTTNMLDYPCVVFKKRFPFMITREVVKQRCEEAKSDAAKKKYKKILDFANLNPHLLTFEDTSPVRPSAICWLPYKDCLVVDAKCSLDDAFKYCKIPFKVIA